MIFFLLNYWYLNLNKYILITEKPETPQSLSVTEILSRAVRLSWSQGFDGNSPLEAYTIQYCALSAQGAIRVSHWDSASTLNVSVHGPSHAHVMYVSIYFRIKLK